MQIRINDIVWKHYKNNRIFFIRIATTNEIRCVEWTRVESNIKFQENNYGW